MAVDPVRHAGDEGEQVAVRIDCERAELGGQDRLEREDLVREGPAKDGHIDVVSLLELAGAVQHAVVLHARVPREHAMGAGSAYGQTRPLAMTEPRHKGGFGRAKADLLDESEGGYLNGTHDLRRSRAAQLRKVELALLL